MANTHTQSLHQDLVITDLADENAGLVDDIAGLQRALDDALETSRTLRLVVSELLQRLNTIEQRDRRLALAKRAEADARRQHQAMAVRS